MNNLDPKQELATTARLSRIVAVAATAAFLLGPLFAKFGLISPMRGFLLFALALPLAILAIALGFLGLFATRRSSGKSGSRSAWFSAVAGLILLLIIGSMGRGAGDAPAIHDITTNLEDPPSFETLAKDPANAGIDLSFPHGAPNTSELHRQAYADLRPLQLQRTPSEALELAKTVATDLGWTIVASTGPAPLGAAPATDQAASSSEEPAEESAESGAADENPGADQIDRAPRMVQATIEATDTSGIFRFVDDIAIRIRGPQSAADARSTVDVRSKSRDGQSDLGVNAKRIRAFLDALHQATGPKPGS